MQTTVFRFFAIAAIVALSATAARITAQSNRPTANEDVLGALLVEVRGLRAAMEQMASAGPRAQLALARLQLQEQRINTMLRRLDAVRDNLAAAQGEVTSKQSEVALREATLREESLTTQHREAIVAHLKSLKSEMARPLADVQRLTGEETTLASEITAEQARWADFNQRLEELERALGRR